MRSARASSGPPQKGVCSARVPEMPAALSNRRSGPVTCCFPRPCPGGFQRETMQERMTAPESAAFMKRRDLIKLGGMALAQAGTARLPLLAQAAMPMPLGRSDVAALADGKADYTLRIARVTVELDRAHIISTIGYNGIAPGPLLRMREGKPVAVDVINDTDTPEFVHWHGMLIPPEVDGTGEEGSPFVPPHGQRRFQLTPGPAGTRWYHSHAMAMDDLHKGSYTGQVGFVYVDGGNHPRP